MAKTKTLTGFKRIDKKLLLAIVGLLATGGLYLVFGASAGTHWVMVSSSPAQDPFPNDGCGQLVADHTPAEQQYELTAKSHLTIEAASANSNCTNYLGNPTVRVKLPYFEFERVGRYKVCYFLRNVNSTGDSSVNVKVSGFGRPAGEVIVSKRNVYDARCTSEFLLNDSGTLTIEMWPKTGTARVADIWLERKVEIEDNNWVKPTDPSVGL